MHREYKIERIIVTKNVIYYITFIIYTSSYVRVVSPICVQIIAMNIPVLCQVKNNVYFYSNCLSDVIVEDLLKNGDIVDVWRYISHQTLLNYCVAAVADVLHFQWRLHYLLLISRYIFWILNRVSCSRWWNHCLSVFYLLRFLINLKKINSNNELCCYCLALS